MSISGVFRNLSEISGHASVIGRFLSGYVPSVASPWLIVVVRFQDDDRTTFLPSDDQLAQHRRLFTAAGTGSLNLVDYFRDMSHGKIDLSGSQVVGPYTVPYRRADYVGNLTPVPAGKVDRGGILAAGRAAAAKNDINAFAGVVVCGLHALDLCGWVGGMAALCDSGSLMPSLLGQELGHGYGLDHSRVDGSVEDYRDKWDTMSTANAWSAQHPEYTWVGPGLNAWNMRMRGWLNEDRVVSIPQGVTTSREVVLKPLHDHTGEAAAAEAGGYLVEFRSKDRWDAGIPRSCILVHRAAQNRSYLVPSSSGSEDLGVGDVMDSGPTINGARVRVEVLGIDESTRTAKIRLDQTWHALHVPQNVWTWPPEIRRPGPVEVELVARLRERLDRYSSAIELAGRFARPQLVLDAIGDLAEELGRQASKVEVTTNHPGISFDPDVIVATPAPARPRKS